MRAQSDIYSFGMLLWAIHQRKEPFEGYTPVMAAFATACQQKRPPLDEFLLSDDGKLAAPLIRSCWAHAPEDRPEMSHCVLKCAENAWMLRARRRSRE